MAPKNKTLSGKSPKAWGLYALATLCMAVALPIYGQGPVSPESNNTGSPSQPSNLIANSPQTFEKGDETIVSRDAAAYFYDKIDHMVKAGDKITVLQYNSEKHCVYFLSADAAGKQVAFKINEDALEISKKASSAKGERNNAAANAAPDKKPKEDKSAKRSRLSMEIMDLEEKVREMEQKVQANQSKKDAEEGRRHSSYRVIKALKKIGEDLQKSLDDANAKIKELNDEEAALK